MQKLIGLISLVLVCILIQGCSYQTWQETPTVKSIGVEQSTNENGSSLAPVNQSSPIVESPAEQPTPPIVNIPKIHRVKVAAIGDILIHSNVYHAAQTKSTPEYDFTSMFSHVKPYLEQADIAIANQETMIGGVKHGLSDYPRFNSPSEVGNALKYAGIDLVTLANNHSLDRGEKVLHSALEYWDGLEMPYTGVFKSQEDRQRIRLLEVNEISFSFLSYTYGTNGIPIPKDKPYLVNLIDLPVMKKDIASAKEQSDVIVVNLHFGNEYQIVPDLVQQELVQALSDEGVHIIFGHHPHVLQPAAWVEGKEGNRTFVAYSLGNFLSGQKGLWKQTGGIVQIEVEKEEKEGRNVITLKNPAFVPTWVYENRPKRQIEIQLLQETKDQSLSAVHFEKVRKHMSQWMPEMKFYFFDFSSK